MAKLIYYLEKAWGDDLGRGKSRISKKRHKRRIKVRLRRFIESILNY